MVSDDDDRHDYWIEIGHSPLINPVPVQRAKGRRPNAHHNPLEPFRAEGRLRYNPPVPRQRVRAMRDERWAELFAALRSDRDRALLAITVSAGVRASELVGIRGADVDWGDQLVRVHRKGTAAEQWLPASAEAFVWLRLYLESIEPIGPAETIWWTLRRRDQRQDEARTNGFGEVEGLQVSLDAARSKITSLERLRTRGTAKLIHVGFPGYRAAE